MKRIFTLLLCFLMLSSCGNADTASHTRVKINYPDDSTVNGYRVSQSVTDGMPSTVSKVDTYTESSVVSDISSKEENAKIQYCANINSHVFHLPDCSSVSTIKEHNKLFLSDRDTLIADGYKPCGRCNP